MTPAIRIGVAGLGTVGIGVLRLLSQHADLLARRCGRRLVVDAVSARDRSRDRGVDLSSVRWFDDAAALAEDVGHNADNDAPCRLAEQSCIKAARHFNKPFETGATEHCGFGQGDGETAFGTVVSALEE